MAPATGYIRRLTRRLTEDLDQRDAQEMTEVAVDAGATRVCDCRRGDEVTMIGRLRTVETCSKAASASVHAELFDGSEAVTLIWIGQRRIPGIESGKVLLVRGRLGERDGGKVIYNPYYEIRTEA